MNKSTQILVVGGGPAGSTTATFLAREGFDVTLMEREVFPRYHIGESLLPSCLHILDLLGARQKIEDHGFQRKDGVYFQWGSEQWDFSFGELSGDRGYSFQVVRSEFDQLLLEHAKSEGVRVFEGVEISNLFFDGTRPRRATWSDSRNESTGEIAFDFLVDASGRAGIMSARHFGNRSYHKVFQNVALWGYWKRAKKLANGPQGAIAVASIPNGWFWAIPLHNGTLSVGLVLHKTTFKEKRKSSTLEQIYMEAIKDCPLVADLVESGELASPLKAEQDYSYAAAQFAGQGYFLAGDAACFLDPLLSTGVHLATFSGLLVAASITSILRHSVGEEEAIAFYKQSYRQAYLRLLVLVSVFYQHHRGRASYFWEAQQLTKQDYDGIEVIQAFLNIVTGVEDLKDVEAAPDRLMKNMSELQAEHINVLRHKAELASMTDEEREQAIAKVKFFNSTYARFSLSPETAVDGLYVVTAPQLGLGRVDVAV